MREKKKVSKIYVLGIVFYFVKITRLLGKSLNLKLILIS